MKVNIAKIIKQNALRESIQTELTPEMLGITKEDADIKGSIALDFEIANVGDVILLEGTIGAVVERSCGRCLKAYTAKYTGDFKEKFYPLGTEGIGEDELVFTDDFVDITETVREALLLSIPIQSLCRQDCRGLCHVCGADNNEIDCDCKAQVINPKFAALQSLLKK